MVAVLWIGAARTTFDELQNRAAARKKKRLALKKQRSSRDEGLFRQVVKCVDLLAENPRHPGLQTHTFTGIEHPFTAGEKVFEAYVQNRTPGAYRLIWCYGPEAQEITIIAIMPHP